MTLIDKAEALLPCPFCGGAASHNGGGGSVFGRMWWTVGCKACDIWFSDPEVWSKTDHGMLDPAYPPKHCFTAWNRRAALPARGVGVSADVKDYAIDVSEAYDTMMEVQRNPAGAWQVIQALAGHIAALAPTDAAQAREAALREAAAVVEEEIRQAKQYFPQSVPILRGVSDRILALIGDRT